MASNNKRSNTAVLLRNQAAQENQSNKQYKMEPVLLTQSWEAVKNSCIRRDPSTKRSK